MYLKLCGGHPYLLIVGVVCATHLGGIWSGRPALREMLVRKLLFVLNRLGESESALGNKLKDREVQEN